MTLRARTEVLIHSTRITELINVLVPMVLVHLLHYLHPVVCLNFRPLGAAITKNSEPCPCDHELMVSKKKPNRSSISIGVALLLHDVRSDILRHWLQQRAVSHRTGRRGSCLPRNRSREMQRYGFAIRGSTRHISLVIPPRLQTKDKSNFDNTEGEGC